jgi:hypothetical protein
VYKPKLNIFCGVLFGCKTWYFILREIHRLGLFENQVLRRIFELTREEVTRWWRKFHIHRKFIPKKEEVTRGWKKLYNEMVYNLYFSNVKVK